MMRRKKISTNELDLVRLEKSMSESHASPEKVLEHLDELSHH